MFYGVRVNTVLLEDPSSYVHVGQLTTSSNSSSGGSDALF